MAFKFMKTGAESAKMAQQAAQEAEQRKEQIGKLWRFFLKDKEDARITFVDGDLNAEGFLCPPRWYEHNLYLNGNWNNFFVCPEKTNPEAHDTCPIDVSGDRPALVAAFTIIDHRTYTGKNNVVYKDTRRLLVAKPQTFELLNKLAVKLGGLAGQTFDVSRVGDKSASVGSLFIPIEKKPIEELKTLYTREVTDPKTNVKSKVTNFVPADYEAEITYRTGDELRKLGLGQPGAQPLNPGGTETDKPVDYSAQL